MITLYPTTLTLNLQQKDEGWDEEEENEEDEDWAENGDFEDDEEWEED